VGAPDPAGGDAIADHGGADPTLQLQQSDFDDGTYRITKPGTYVLQENIAFCPLYKALGNPKRRLRGFEAAMIETGKADASSDAFAGDCPFGFKKAAETECFGEKYLLRPLPDVDNGTCSGSIATAYPGMPMGQDAPPNSSSPCNAGLSRQGARGVWPLPPS
jgi:hypothetical protein